MFVTPVVSANGGASFTVYLNEAVAVSTRVGFVVVN
jgi:hypothetical protein